MALVTVELRNLLKTDFELFDFSYKFDDVYFKTELEQAVIDYYYFNEIGQETPDRFKHKFRSRWQRIIPYYNDLYNSTLLEYDHFKTTALTERLEAVRSNENTQTNTTESESSGTTNTLADGTNTSTQTTDSLSTDSGTSTTDTQVKDSRYPQQNIQNNSFIANAGDSQSESENTNTNTIDSTTTQSGTTSSEGTSTSNDTSQSSGQSNTTGLENNEYTKVIEGLSGYTYQDLIRKERENLLNITEMIIAEMKPCFILTYN